MSADLAVGIGIGATVGSSVSRVFGAVETRSRRVGEAFARTNKQADHFRAELKRLRAEKERTGDASGELQRRIQTVGETLRRTTRRAAAYREELRRGQRLERARESRDRALRRGGVALGAAYGVGRLVTASFERERAELRLGSLLAGPAREAELGRARRSRAPSREDQDAVPGAIFGNRLLFVGARQRFRVALSFASAPGHRGARLPMR